MKPYQKVISYGILSAVGLAGTLGLAGCEVNSEKDPGKEEISGTVIFEKYYEGGAWRTDKHDFVLSTKDGLKLFSCMSDIYASGMDTLINKGYKVKVNIPKNTNTKQNHFKINLEHISEVEPTK